MTHRKSSPRLEYENRRASRSSEAAFQRKSLPFLENNLNHRRLTLTTLPRKSPFAEDEGGRQRCSTVPPHSSVLALISEEREKERTLKNELKAIKKQVNELSVALQRLEQENTELKSMNAHGGKILRERDDKLRRRQCSLNKLVIDCGEAFNNLISLHGEADDARKDYYISTRDVEEARASRRLDTKSEFLSRFENERDCARASLKKLEVEEDELRDELFRIHKQCEEKKNKIEKLKKRTSARDLFIKALEKTHMNNHTVVYLDQNKQDNATKKGKKK